MRKNNDNLHSKFDEYISYCEEFVTKLHSLKKLKLGFYVESANCSITKAALFFFKVY